MKAHCGCGVRHGFTLLELLIVLGILAILAAILVPAFARAQGNARALSCLSNQRQIGLAATQYVQDYDELYFPREHPGVITWRGLIAVYARSRYIFACPDNPSHHPGYFDNVTADYAINNAPAFAGDGCGNFCHLSHGPALAALESPAQKILITELKNEEWDDYSSPWWPSIPSNWRSGFAGHTGRFHLLFLDGHVKAQKPTATIAVFDEWDYWRDTPPAGASDSNAALRLAMQSLEAQYNR